MKQPMRKRFRPGVEGLEDRCVPSTVQLPFKETFTFLGLQGGVASYAGTGTHVGKVSALEYFNPAFNPADPNSVFATYVKYAANGDTLVGRVLPDNPANPFTTGLVTIDGGTGRFAGATGVSQYIVSSNAKTGATILDITGSISYDPAAAALAPHSAAAQPTITQPFKITGGGLAAAGLPLIPGLSADHPATGTGTDLGKYTGAGSFTLGSLSISPTGQVSGTFQGSFVFVAANGDKLAMTYGDGFTGVVTGQLTADGTAVVNVKFDAIFTPDAANSTGRFADVTGGGFRMIAQADSISLIPGSPYTAPFDYTWSGEGSLVFAKGK